MKYCALLIAAAILIPLPLFAGPTLNGSGMAGLAYGCDDPETPALDTDLTCYRLGLQCGTATTAARYNDFIADVEIRERAPAAAAVGSVVFFDGGFGNQFYDNGSGSPTGATVAALRAAGYTTFEVRWLNDTGGYGGEGWLSGMGGRGPKEATCGAREIIEWLKDNKSSGVSMCATGNSFGGVQIAYAIAAYDAGQFLQSAVYSAGPSVTDLPRGCFAQTYDNGTNGTPQSITAGFRCDFCRSTIINPLMAWTDPANHCGTDSSHPTLSSTYNTPAAKAMALVSYGTSIEPRDYAPPTRQFFVEADQDATGATVQGAIYYIEVTGFKGLSIISNVHEDTPGDHLVHTVHDSDTGSRLIQAYLLDPENCQ